MCSSDLDLYRRSSWERLMKIGPVHLIHRGEIVDIGQKDRRANNRRKAKASGGQKRAQVVHHAACTRRDIACDQLSGFRIDWNLPGHEKELPDAERWRVRAPGRRGVRAGDQLFHAAFVTLPERRHRVQTLIRLVPPPMLARTF